MWPQLSWVGQSADALHFSTPLPSGGVEGQSLCKLLLLGPSIILDGLIWGINSQLQQVISHQKINLCKSRSYALTPGIYPSFVISTWQTTNSSPIKALFCRRMLEKVILPVYTAHYLWIEKGWVWRSFWMGILAKGHGFKAQFWMTHNAVT